MDTDEGIKREAIASPMNWQQIEVSLRSKDLQERLRAITALRAYDSKVSVPLLCQQLNDPDSVVRSVVAASLGKKRTPESFNTLRDLLYEDPEANVRAEAATSLVMFGDRALKIIIRSFREDPHWLVRRSIMAALLDLPLSDDLMVEVFNLCAIAIRDPNPAVQEVGIDGLGTFAATALRTAALDKLLPLVKSHHWETRMAVTQSLRQFDNHQAREALTLLGHDVDYRVVGAVLEGLV